MSTEELMQPRYKVIADYPGSIFKKGEILSEDKVFNKVTYYNCGMYPHLFKKLEWWEERDEKDIPEYVRVNNGNKIYQVESFTPGFAKLSNNKGEWNWYRLSPATCEEYEQYLSLQKLKK